MHALLMRTIPMATGLGHGALSCLGQVNVGTLRLLVEVVSNSSKGDGGDGKKTNKDTGGGGVAT
jgi:hypothetical protein